MLTPGTLGLNNSHVEGRVSSQWAENGYFVSQGLIAKQLVAELNDQLVMVERNLESQNAKNLRYRHKVVPSTQAIVLDSIDPILDVIPAVAKVLEQENLRDLLRIIFGEEACLFKDKAIVKPPGCPGYPWHQDHIEWPVFPASFLTVVIPLCAVNARNGAIRVVPGSHKQGYLSARDGDFHDLPATFAQGKEVTIDMAEGDALFFGSMLVHGSGMNLSDAPRRSLYLSFNKASDGGDLRSLHYRYFHAWLRKRYSEYGAQDTYFR